MLEIMVVSSRLMNNLNQSKFVSATNLGSGLPSVLMYIQGCQVIVLCFQYHYLSNIAVVYLNKCASVNCNLMFSVSLQLFQISLQSFQRFRKLFTEKNGTTKRFNAYKCHWSETRVPVILEVNQGSLDQLHPATGCCLCSYDYKDMEGLTQVADYPGGVAVIHGGFSRLVSILSTARLVWILVIQSLAYWQINSSSYRHFFMDKPLLIALRLGESSR